MGRRGWKKQKQVNLVLLNLAYIMEGADVALLPAVYQEIGKEMLISPTGLGSLTLARKMVQTLCYPLSAVLATSYNRATVIALGMTVWAVSTAGVGAAQSFAQVAFTRAMSGVGIALVAPAVMSMVADSTDATHRGLGFGLLHVTGTLGHMLGGVLAILFAGSTALGIQGWRLVFLCVALLSELIALLVYAFLVDTRRADLSADFSLCVSPSTDFSLASKVIHDPARPFRAQLAEFLADARKVVSIPSFQVLAGLGIPGSFPLSAAAFFPMWLELTGFTHGQTAYLQTLFTSSRAVGTVLIGLAADSIAVLLPNAGRILTAQLCTASAVFVSAVMLLGLQPDPSAMWQYGVTLCMLGFITSSLDSATNSPIYAEIVHSESRVTVYALDHFFESLLAAFATPTVGLLASKVFGYRMGAAKGADPHNADSLANALYSCFGIPYTVCALIYSLLYWTYPRDRDRIRWEVSQVELQVELAETDVEEPHSSRSGTTQAEYKHVGQQDDDVEEELNVDDTHAPEASLETTHMLSHVRSRA